MLRGSAGGLTTTGAARYSQDTTGIPGSAEFNDVFSSQVRLAGLQPRRQGGPRRLRPRRERGHGALWQLRATSGGLSTSGISVYGPMEYGVSSGSGIGETLLG